MSDLGRDLAWSSVPCSVCSHCCYHYRRSRLDADPSTGELAGVDLHHGGVSEGPGTVGRSSLGEGKQALVLVR